MPALKIQGSPAREAMLRAVQDIGYMRFGSKAAIPEDKITDYLMGLLWIEGFKVVPLDRGEN